MVSSLSLRQVPAAASLAGNYDAWLCDIWGVVHNGVETFAQALIALERYRDTGGTVVLISNSPRPSPQLRLQLDELAVPEECYDATVTSGDVTRALLELEPGAQILHLGPERDRPLFAGLDVTPVEIDDADLVLCTGLFDDTTETPDDYAGLLDEALSLELPMICANPDHVVQRGDKLIYCAGALAAVYEEAGGETIYAGKPHPPIYVRALSMITDLRGQEISPQRTLAIGDNANTDLAGAAAMGLDALFISGGIHAGEVVDGSDHEGAAITIEIDGAIDTDKVIGYQPELAW